MEFLSDALAHALDSPDSLAIEFLGRELDGGISGVYTCKLDVLTDGISNDFTVFGHSIHLYFLGMFNELTYDDRMVFAHISCQFQEAFELIPVGAHVHGGSREHV